MRDPARIDKMVRLLAIYWKQNPDLRLSQIVGNAAGELAIAPYALEDESLQAWLSMSVRYGVAK